MCALKTLIVQVIILTAVFYQPLASRSQETQGTSTNGCGSSWSQPFVPNRIRVANCEFESSCNSHDVCYGQCTPGGTLFGKSTCDYLKCRPGGPWHRAPQCDGKEISLSESDAGKRRLQCDRQLGADIAKSNPKKPICEAMGWVYKEAVSLLGQPNFSGVGNGGNRQSKMEYERELRRFLESATDEELKDFSTAASIGQPVVDLTKPIIYISGSGLKNKTAPLDEKP